MARRKNDRRARNTGGLRQKGANVWEGRLRVRRKDGSFIEKSFSRNTKTECQEVINILRGYENLDKKLNNLGANILVKEGE